MTAKRTMPNKSEFAEAKAEASTPRSNSMPRIIKMRKIVSDDPVWFVTVAGSSAEMKIIDAQNLTNYKRFNTEAFKQLDLHFMPVKQSDWAEAIIDALQLMTQEQAPEDTTQRGQFMELLESFLTNRQRGQKKEDLLSGRPWEDEEKGRHYFELSRLMKFLEREGMRNLSKHDCITWLGKMGGGESPTTVKTRKVRLRWVPSDALQETPDVDPPELPSDKI